MAGSDPGLNFSGCQPVNHLWPQLVERLGTDKAQRAVCQALDLQGMHGDDSTLPVLLVATCGLTLVSTDLLRHQSGLACHGSRMVLLLSVRDEEVQLLQQA